MNHNDHIKEILTEADAYGLKWEVETLAKKFLKENEKLTKQWLKD